MITITNKQKSVQYTPILLGVLVLSVVLIGFGAVHASDDYDYSYNYTAPCPPPPPPCPPAAPAPVYNYSVPGISLTIPTGNPSTFTIPPITPISIGIPTGTPPSPVIIPSPAPIAIGVPIGDTPTPYTYPVSPGTGLSVPIGDTSTYTGYSYAPIQTTELAYTSPYIPVTPVVSYTNPAPVAPAPVVLGALNVRTGASGTATEGIAGLGALLIAAGYFVVGSMFRK